MRAEEVERLWREMEAWERGPEHWLISVRLPPNTHLHGYLMGSGKAIELGCDRMTNVCAKGGFEMREDNVLVTQLDTNGVKLVREVVSASRRCKEGLATATDFYFSFWTMGDEDPRAVRLLALH
jgi:hypothetical protein